MLTATTTKNLKLQNLELFKNYQQSPNIKLRNKIVELNFGLVRKEAHYWVNQCSQSYEDLLQVGSIGLIRAIERFSVDKGNAFSSFALPYIRGEIQHYLRDKSSSVKIPRRWMEIRRQAVKITREFQQNYHRQPSDREIAAKLELSLEKWQEIKLAHQNKQPLSLDVSVNHEREGNASLADLVPDPNYHSFQLAQDDRIRLQSALSQLEERTRNVLEFVFLKDLTQKETAELLGISVVTVARQIKKGVKALKKSMEVA